MTIHLFFRISTEFVHRWFFFINTHGYHQCQLSFIVLAFSIYPRDWGVGLTKLDRQNEKDEEATARGTAVKDGDHEHTLVNEIHLPARQKQQQEKEDCPVSNDDNKKPFAIVTIHDVAPEYSEKIFRVADELQKLGINYNLAIIPYLKKRKDNLISRNPEFVKKVLGYVQEVVLHGNYHETEEGKIEDFHTFSIEEAKSHLQNAINVLKEAGINTTAFVPPTWAINKPTIDDLIQLGFKLVEGKEEILILDSKKTRKLQADVLNWDQSGSPEKNKEYLAKNKQLYRLKVMQENSRLVRIAIHPRDPEEALQDQIEIIQDLKHMNYSFVSYGEMTRVERLEEAQEEEEQLLQQNLLRSP
jgi:predicted deacetylase